MAASESDDNDISPDREERIEDFLSRHGGRGSTPPREEKAAGGDAGWFEIYASDGYRLRGEWSKMGSREEMTFTEVPP